MNLHYNSSYNSWQMKVSYNTATQHLNESDDIPTQDMYF